MTWGRFHTGTLIWHVLDPMDRRKTLCGRTFELVPWTSGPTAPLDDKCFLCERLRKSKRQQQPQALAAAGGQG